MLDNAQETGTTLVPSSTIKKICAAREAALIKMAEAAATLERGYDLSRIAGELASGAHNGTPVYLDSMKHGDSEKRLHRGDFDAAKSLAAYKKTLDVGIWTHLIDFSGMSTMMDRTAKEELRQSFMGDVPEATEENVSATMRKLFSDADLIFQRGLAVCFSKLERRFRSHDGFKIGSRIILERCFDDWGSWSHYARHDDTLADVERVFAVLDGERPNWGALREKINESRSGGMDPRQSECESDYFRIKGFKNGNAHIWMTRDDLVRKANKLLAKYYGEVIGDAAPAEARTDDFLGTALVPWKDLQFFATPDAVVERLLDGSYLGPDVLVLEPSAGKGSIVRKVVKTGAGCHAVEIHPERCAELFNIAGCFAHCENFLTWKAAPIYDCVVMNPPFAGTHWMNHVRHAWDLLKPGGQLRAVLPASAEVNESKAHLAFRRWAERESRDNWGQWRSLPAESFAETGTRIQTVILMMLKRDT